MWWFNKLGDGWVNAFHGFRVGVITNPCRNIDADLANICWQTDFFKNGYEGMIN